MLLLILAYLGGALTILSPCILPVLPFVFARSDKPFVRAGLPMLVGMAVTFAVVASLAAVGSQWVADANKIGRWIALALMAAFALALLWPGLANRIGAPLQALGSRLSRSADAADDAGQGGVGASLLLGVATGLLWAPCAGPILGLVLTGAALNGASVGTTALLLAYALGAASSLAVALLIGGRVFAALKRSLGLGEWVRRGLGALALAAVAAIALGLDTGLLTRLSASGTARAEQALLDRFHGRPMGSAAMSAGATPGALRLTSFAVESPGLHKQTVADAGAMASADANAMMKADAGAMMSAAANAMMKADAGAMMQPEAGAMMMAAKAAEPPVHSEGMLPSLAGAQTWLNSAPLDAKALRGKVVLVDFWTYSCINCLRTLPYVREWARKYKDQGLVVIGVHTPEFAFERDPDNVRRAVRDLGVTYPVALDNGYAIWRAFDNQYWPAHYFIDAQGRIRAHHFGEGGYAESEATLRQLLQEAGMKLPMSAANTDARGVEQAADTDNLQSPETYVGYARAEHFASEGGLVRDRGHDYAQAKSLMLNQWGLSGMWTVGPEDARLDEAGGRVAFRFHARDLHLVLAPGRASGPVRFRVRVDGQPPGAAHGEDTDAAGLGVVDQHRLYQLVRQRGDVGEHTFEIEFLDAGARAYAFTFG